MNPGETLRRRRERLGHSVLDLAALAGVAAPRIMAAERGEVPLEFADARKLAAVLGKKRHTLRKSAA